MEKIIKNLLTKLKEIKTYLIVMGTIIGVIYTDALKLL